MISDFAEAAEVVRNTMRQKYPQVRRAFIFGSFAGHSHGEASDLDVLVELSVPIGLEFISMVQDLEAATGMPVDIVTLKQARELESKYGYNILQKARIVYDRSAS